MVSDMLTPGLLSSQIELIMEAIHKNRNLQYKKTMEVKQVCCCFLPCGLMLLTHTQTQSTGTRGVSSSPVTLDAMSV